MTSASVPTSVRVPATRARRPDGEFGEPGVLVNIYRAAPAAVAASIHMSHRTSPTSSCITGMFAFPKTASPSPADVHDRELPNDIRHFIDLVSRPTSRVPTSVGSRRPAWS